MTSKTVEFASFGRHEALVRRIVSRARSIYRNAGRTRSTLDITMDLSATHATMPLDLEKLAGFDDPSLIHDIAGIELFLDRSTGEMGGCFVPRCALPETTTTDPEEG